MTKCDHVFNFIDKWTDQDGRIWYEFYCQHCLEIVIKTAKNEVVKK